MKLPVDHILRPQLPWRLCTPGGITECGYDANAVKTLTRDEYFTRIKDLGRQRTAMVTCMTCADTAARWGGWEDDPRKALEREIIWESGYRYTDRGTLLRDELEAIAWLISEHRTEFDAAVEKTGQRRKWLGLKARHFGERGKE